MSNISAGDNLVVHCSVFHFCFNYSSHEFRVSLLEDFPSQLNRSKLDDTVLHRYAECNFSTYIKGVNLYGFPVSLTDFCDQHGLTGV